MRYSPRRGGGGCGFGSTADQYTGTRFEYANNGQSLTHALGETWCWDEGSPSSTPTNYAVTWARQFLSDGARQRFRDIELDPVALMGGNLVQLGGTTTTYDGDQAYFSTGTTPTGYEPGLGRVQMVSGATLTRYDHTDMLGTTRYMTDSDGQITQQAAYTAFGERVSGTANRFGYIGAWGYQSTVDTSGQEVMPFLHVGARYYDPSSGRFLQRDPIGIRGGLNVYSYVGSVPTIWVDPDGLYAGAAAKIGGGFALADGPLPIGDAIGAAIFAIGVAVDIGILCFAKEHTKGRRKSTHDKHTKRRPGGKEKKKLKPEWQPNPNKRPPGSCFTGDTVVETSSGSVAIRDLAVGVAVVCGNAIDATTTLGMVTVRFEHIVTELLAVRLEHETIRTTPEHPFWVVTKGWVTAGAIRPGDKLVSGAGSEVVVIETRTISLDEPIQVFNISVEPARTYFVGESKVLVHNKVYGM